MQRCYLVNFIYAGNHYGTPKPSKESKPSGSSSTPSRLPDESSTLTSSSTGGISFPGAHPSSEGKRRRNRSNVEAMTAKNFQEELEKDNLGSTQSKNSCSVLKYNKVIFPHCVFKLIKL